MSDIMERYRKETRFTEDVLREHEREIKRFLVMGSTNPRTYGMRGPLDDLWHTFIIFTKSYMDFCEQLGGEYIHHFPDPPDEPAEDRELRRGSYLEFLTDYEEIFGEEAPRHIWPRPADGVMSPSCGNCGNFCYQTCAA